MFPALRFTEEEIADYLENASSAMVRGSLARARHDWFDLLNLISPAAYPFMGVMRDAARIARRRYYGKTVSVYAPLYIGNTCINSCRYCDFRRQHTGTVRRNLTLDEIRAEANAIRETGIDSLLVVAGEDPRVNTVAHLADVGRMLKSMFSNLSLEVAPQTEDGYRELFEAFYLMRECYEAKVQFAFPRICRVEGGFVPPCEVDERDLELMMLAFRIVFPQCCITVSTREPPAFRDRIVLTAADNMSAGSRVTPGGYAVLAENHKQDVAQFTLSDSRTPNEVYAAIRANGQEVVFKNWDNRI